MTASIIVGFLIFWGGFLTCACFAVVKIADLEMELDELRMGGGR